MRFLLTCTKEWECKEFMPRKASHLVEVKGDGIFAYLIIRRASHGTDGNSCVIRIVGRQRISTQKLLKTVCLTFCIPTYPSRLYPCSTPVAVTGKPVLSLLPSLEHRYVAVGDYPQIEHCCKGPDRSIL